MRETERICQQMKQMAEGEAWHGPCAADILPGITTSMATTRPAAGLHNIWEILAHLTRTHAILIERIETGKDAGEDFPAVPPPTDAAWQQALDDFRVTEQRLRALIAGLPDDRLDAPLKPGGSSAYNNFHGNIQHTAYHLAQIGLLKKLQQLQSAG